MIPLPLTLSPHFGTLACGLGCFPLDNGAYPPLSHSQGTSWGIRGLVEFGKLTPPSPSSALPPQDYLEAVPKYISGRTSYLRVRLAFHPYPQLIPAFCTRHGFGPSPRYYRGFNLAMGRSPGFGSNPDNTPDIVETSPPTSCPGGSSLRFAPNALRRSTGSPGTCAPDGPYAWRSMSRPGRSTGSSASARSRPIRTRFRCGSGTDIP